MLRRWMTLLTIVLLAGSAETAVPEDARPLNAEESALVRKLQTAPEALDRSMAVRQMGMRNDGRFVNPIATALTDSADRVRLSAVRALGDIANDEAAGELNKAALDTTQLAEVRTESLAQLIQAASKHRLKAAFESIAQLRTAPDKLVKSRAEDSLPKLLATADADTLHLLRQTKDTSLAALVGMEIARRGGDHPTQKPGTGPSEVAGAATPHPVGEPALPEHRSVFAPLTPLDLPRMEEKEKTFWSSVTTSNFYHNRHLRRWDPVPHADILDGYPIPDDLHRELAKTVAAEAYAGARHIYTLDAGGPAIEVIPAVLDQSLADAALKPLLLGHDPIWHGRLDASYHVQSLFNADKYRIVVTAEKLMNVYVKLLTRSIADSAESYCQKRYGAHPLPDNCGLFIERTFNEVGQDPLGSGGSMARISYAGDTPLHDVFIFTGATMSPPGPRELVSQALVGMFNEAFSPNDPRNEIAQKYLTFDKILRIIPQGQMTYVPLVEPGDVLYVLLFDNTQGLQENLKESRLSCYCDCGTIIGKVLEVGGPWNDSNSKLYGHSPVTKPLYRSVGAPFTKSRAMLTLGGATHELQTCVPVGDSYLPLGTNVTVGTSKPLFSIARGDGAYVAMGPEKHTGAALVLIPKSMVRSIKKLDSW